MTRFALPLVVLSLAAVLWPAAAAQQGALKPLREWRGSVMDEALMKQAPAGQAIANEKTFAALWKAWEPEKKVPEVNFQKELVLVAATRGSRLNLSTRLTEGGDLKAAALSTRDLRPGFRYHIIVIPREGVKTVNGKPLAGG
ncbi:MAG: hypothetical protein IT429_16330 [Gemmataceae bacterium]|nr:hypothetical protein [Gemmataceae bacterium]